MSHASSGARPLPMMSWSEPRTSLRVALLALATIACVIVVHRYQVLNGFSILPGDRYDSVIVATILEHWRHVFTGMENWKEVGYFFPYQRTIAQTDAYFLIGVIYLPFRLLGVDPFLSAELCDWVLKAVGLVGTYIFCRKVFSFSFYWALLAAVLFTLSNGITQHSHRVQLATVSFAPIMATLIWSAVQHFLAGDARTFRRAGITAGLFFGAWCLTCFYMAWFFTLFFTVFTLVILAWSGPSARSVLMKRLAGHYGSVLTVLATTGIAMIPFVYAFLPKSREVGVRPYESVAAYTIHPEDILEVGHGNLLLGRPYKVVLSYLSPHYTPTGAEYYNTGFAILLFALFVGGCLRFLRSGPKYSESMVLPCMIATTLFTWLLTLNIGGHSAWVYVYTYFPGAKALNVVSAYQLLLALPVTVIAVKFLSGLRLHVALTLLIAVLLIAEEFNQPYINLQRQAEIDRISLPYPVPKECKAFYASGWADLAASDDWTVNNYAHNVSAMLIAQEARIPTVNGFASFNPPDWNFGFPHRKDYDSRVVAYARSHAISGLCRLDLSTKMWSLVAVN